MKKILILLCAVAMASSALAIHPADLDQNQEFSLEEFLAMTRARETAAGKTYNELFFRELYVRKDVDGDGVLSYQELATHPKKAVVLKPECKPTVKDGDLRLPRLFSEHMVLQAGAACPVWGWATPEETVTVAVAGQTQRAKVDANGRWELKLAPVKAGGPYVMTICSGAASVSIKDVVFGEVWLASGQSNMAWRLRQSDGLDEAKQQAGKRKIRFFYVPQRFSMTELDELEGGEWVVCTADNISDYSAVAYYFACALDEGLNSTIAIVQSAWGGTTAQNWTPLWSLKENPDLANYAEEVKENEDSVSAIDPSPNFLADLESDYLRFYKDWVRFRDGKLENQPVHPGYFRPRLSPTLTYNGMIHPLAPYQIKGTIWYQGEANANNKCFENYSGLFATMIESWRRQWRDDFYFIFAQLPEYHSKGREHEWITIRDEQRRTLDLVQDSSMVVTLGYGDMNDIHPVNKLPVGLLFARAALTNVYNQDYLWTGPLIQTARWQEGGLVLSFQNVGSGLRCETETLEGFEVSVDGEEFVSVTAHIKGDEVVIPNEDKVRYVRYAWSVDPALSLRNVEGLVASPFQVEVR